MAPNEEGVSMGQAYTIVRDLDAAKKFWTLMGSTPVKVGEIDAVKILRFKRVQPSWGFGLQLLPQESLRDNGIPMFQ